MKRRLIQSYYSFDMTDKEMGKLRRLRGIHTLVNKIANRDQIKGVIFTDSAVQVNIAAGEQGVRDEAKEVQQIIKEELI